MSQLSVNGIQNPGEIAHEILQNLLNHLQFLEGLCKHCGDLTLLEIESSHLSIEFQKNFLTLIDGINTLTEAVHSVKKTLKIGLLPPLQILEADLLSILQDTVTSQNPAQISYFKELLCEHLPKNLSEWRTIGIPLIIRSRDS